MRVVFDTNTVVSALLFAEGRLAWLRLYWRQRGAVPLVSRWTVEELIRVLSYPKFRLERPEIEALLADYLPFAEPVEVSRRPRRKKQFLCEDTDDQMFVDLCLEGQADVIVTGDKVLLDMEIGIPIETPARFRDRVESS